MKTAIDTWNDYAKILPRDASSTQVRETKMAFLSGMLSLIALLSQIANLSEDEGAKTIEDTHESIICEILKTMRESPVPSQAVN
jgi:hypothetical protein